MGDPLTTGLGAIGATMHAVNLLRAFSDVRDATKVLELKAELMGLLVEAQTAQLSLVGEKDQLAARIRELEAWDGEKQRYDMVDAGNGCMAYALKADASPPEPAHYLCAQCYQQRRKSILVPFLISTGRAQALQCHACDSEMIVQGVDLREQAKINARKPAPKPGTYRF